MGDIFEVRAGALGLAAGGISILIGIFILATFLALFNYLTPSGKVTVTGRVVEVTPNVSGQIIAIPVKPNVPVKSRDILFQIDRAPFQYKVAQLKASLAGAQQQTRILKSNYEQAAANVAGLTAQLAFNTKRLADIRKLAEEGANTEFSEQDTQVQYEAVGRNSTRPRRRSRAPSWRSIPGSAASTQRWRKSRRSLKTPIGNCHRPRFARLPTLTSPWSR